MLILCQFPNPPMIPNLGPFCMKTECVLRMLDLDYRVELVTDFDSAPRHQVPYLIDDGRKIGDSRVIVDHLQRRAGIDLEAHLDAAARAAAQACRSMLEQDLYFAMVYSRWVDEAGWASAQPLFFGSLPEAVRAAVADGLRADVIARLYQQGIGRHEKAQVYAFGMECIDAAAGMLGDTPFLFGERPGLTDAALYAFVANLAVPLFDSPLRQRVLGHRNLVAHAERMRARYFPDLSAMAA
ncbi:MAG: glutathione S-transferase family protein [Alphaproteobacteria bacterium]